MLCTWKPTEHDTVIVWSRIRDIIHIQNDDPTLADEQMARFTMGEFAVHPSFKNKLQYVEMKNGLSRVRLLGVTKIDEGIYKCRVDLLNKFSFKSSKTLEVAGNYQIMSHFSLCLGIL